MAGSKCDAVGGVALIYIAKRWKKPDANADLHLFKPTNQNRSFVHTALDWLTEYPWPQSP